MLLTRYWIDDIISELFEKSSINFKQSEKTLKKVLDKIKWVWYNDLAVWDSEVMNHDNLRLNSTHNPENSRIFLGENEQSEVRV